MIQQSVCILAWLTWNTTLDFSKRQVLILAPMIRYLFIKTNLSLYFPKRLACLSFLVVLAFPMDWKQGGKKCSFRSAIHALTWTDLFRERQNRGEHNFLKVILLKTEPILPLQTACFVNAQWHRYILIVGISLVIFTQVIFRKQQTGRPAVGRSSPWKKAWTYSFMSAKEKNDGTRGCLGTSHPG